MSGLYLLMVVGIWACLTWLFVKGWRRWRAQSEERQRVDALCLVIALLWLGASFWYGGGRKVYYDTLVNRMCKEDGGVKVYETVKLPAEKFDKWGMVNFYRPTQDENALGPEYIFKSETTYYRKGNPEMSRRQYEVIRRSDGKRLGVSIVYGRGGGDLPGPWHGSSFTCPDLREGPVNTLLKEVFLIENTGEDRK